MDERLNALFRDEVKKAVEEQTKIIKGEYNELLKKAKEEYKDEVLNHKNNTKDATKKIIDDLKEEHQKQRSLLQDEIRKLKEEQREVLKTSKAELVEAKNVFTEKARSIHGSYSDYLRVVSVNYSIPYSVLLRDAPVEEDNICRGLKKNMSRCNLKARCDGYCKHHHSQLVRKHTIEFIDEISSTTSGEVENKGLIDFNSVL
jgi:gas vesicle protein